MLAGEFFQAFTGKPSATWVCGGQQSAGFDIFSYAPPMRKEASSSDQPQAEDNDHRQSLCSGQGPLPWPEGWGALPARGWPLCDPPARGNGLGGTWEGRGRRAGDGTCRRGGLPPQWWDVDPEAVRLLLREGHPPRQRDPCGVCPCPFPATGGGERVWADGVGSVCACSCMCVRVNVCLFGLKNFSHQKQWV